MRRYYFIFFFFFSFISVIYLIINFNSLFDYDKRQLIKKYFFPYKLISQQEQKISILENLYSKQMKELSFYEPYNTKLELDFIESGSDIQITKSIFKISKSSSPFLSSQPYLNLTKNLEKYKLNSGFYYGIARVTPGSGYIDFFENNIFILSARGVLVFKKNLTDVEENFKQVKHNINDFINMKQFNKYRWFSIKDMHISKNKIYISFTEEIEENCWNTSIISGNINYKNIKFKKMFSSKPCVHSINNIDKEFTGMVSGGRIVEFDENHIFLSTGAYRSRHLAQDKKSVNGKVLKINVNSGNYEVISMGHRNPQGLYFDEENNFILETEHGPRGGDEINLIEVEKINKDKIQNYGWAIASAGEHYGGGKKNIKNKKKYEKYPLYKSHSEHGFVEPLISFVPSIGISEITKIGKNKYVVSSLKDRSLYFFELNKKKKIINLEKVKVWERIRDIKYKHNKLYLFLEDTASIGLIDINNWSTELN
jgi:hypothetical protein